MAKENPSLCKVSRSIEAWFSLQSGSKLGSQVEQVLLNPFGSPLQPAVIKNALNPTLDGHGKNQGHEEEEPARDVNVTKAVKLLKGQRKVEMDEGGGCEEDASQNVAARV